MHAQCKLDYRVHLLIISAKLISELMITDGNAAIKKGRTIFDPASAILFS